MDKFEIHTGIAAPLRQSNIDTDAIIPSREMKLVSKQGLGEGLFSSWRYIKPGSREQDPEFILNQQQYQNTSILLGGSNFGCGSSREHAVWALKEYGIRAIIAPSFGSIFFNNCIRNGLLPVILDDSSIEQISNLSTAAPQTNTVEINLLEQSISSSGQQWLFDISSADKNMLIEGLDSIALTLKLADEISNFEKKDNISRQWAVL